MTRYKCRKGALFVLFLDLEVETRVTQKNSDNNSDRVGVVLTCFISELPIFENLIRVIDVAKSNEPTIYRTHVFIRELG